MMGDIKMGLVRLTHELTKNIYNKSNVRECDGEIEEVTNKAIVGR